jgi:hypothetical protein
MDESRPQIDKLWDLLRTGEAISVDEIVELLNIERPGVPRYINWIKQRYKVDVETDSVVVASGSGNRKVRKVSHYRLTKVPKKVAQEEPEERPEPEPVPARNGEFEILDTDNDFTKIGEVELRDIRTSLQYGDQERLCWE